jgi:CRP-like cAMP-binding protein
MAELNVVEKVMALEGVEILKDLTPDQLAKVAAIARELTLPGGRVILDPRRPVDALCVVLDGRVGISRYGEELYAATQNEVLGAWALFDSEPMSITATTLEETRLLRIGRDDFYDLLADHREITQMLFKTMVARFRKLAE